MAAAADRSPPSFETVPRHIAIIMDGNGRWAGERGDSRTAGHRAGADSARAAVKACGEIGVDYLTLYAFSSENWKRPRAEVAALMLLLERFLDQRTQEMLENNIRLEAIGRLDELPGTCRRKLDEAIVRTSGNSGITLVLALSYGGREEIVDAVRSLGREVRDGRLDPEAIDGELFARHLYTRDYPDPDLLIRTSGEMRLSNFLLWQISYTEMVVTPTLWPDFREADLHEAVREFGRRQRRYGGVTAK